MKQFLAILLLIIGATVAQAQTTEPPPKEKPICTLPAGQAPEVGGVRLGMTVEQLLALFPGSSEDTYIRAQLAKAGSKFGEANFSIKPAAYKPKPGLEKVIQITLKFIDGRLATFTVGYNGPEWKNVDEFVAKFSEEKNLPATDAWEAFAGMDTQLKTLSCNGFEVSLFSGGTGGNLNYVKLRDTAAEQTLKERKAKARENAGKETKP